MNNIAYIFSIVLCLYGQFFNEDISIVEREKATEEASRKFTEAFKSMVESGEICIKISCKDLFEKGDDDDLSLKIIPKKQRFDISLDTISFFVFFENRGKNSIYIPKKLRYDTLRSIKIIFCKENVNREEVPKHEKTFGEVDGSDFIELLPGYIYGTVIDMDVGVYASDRLTSGKYLVVAEYEYSKLIDKKKRKYESTYKIIKSNLIELDLIDSLRQH